MFNSPLPPPATAACRGWLLSQIQQITLLYEQNQYPITTTQLSTPTLGSQAINLLGLIWNFAFWFLTCILKGSNIIILLQNENTGIQLSHTSPAQNYAINFVYWKELKINTTSFFGKTEKTKIRAFLIIWLISKGIA